MEFGLKPGDAMDLTTGWILDPMEDRDQARKLLQDTKPKLLTGSPDCKMFSNLQNFTFRAKKIEQKGSIVLTEVYNPLVGFSEIGYRL